MREFILRALKAKTTPDFHLDDLPRAGRIDLVCRCISNTLWISNELRRDTAIHVSLEGPPSPPKLISFYGKNLKEVQPDERNIATRIKEALKKGMGLNLNEETEAWSGIIVAKKSFERFVKEKSGSSQLIYLHPKGTDIREFPFEEDFLVIFGDYIGMPRKTEKLLDRLGAKRVRLGPVVLFASHCPVIIHNEIDRRYEKLSG